MLEIEIKAYCDNHNSVIKKILLFGGKLIKKNNELDIYYKHPVRDFSKTDEAFRIRVENSNNILTYKGPKIGEKTKTRLEEEIGFNNLDSMKNILEKLGFDIAEKVTKHREIYKLNDIEVCIDSVEGVGNFVELEKKGMDKENGEKELFLLAQKLGLSKFETKSYLELLIEKKKIPFL